MRSRGPAFADLEIANVRRSPAKSRTPGWHGRRRRREPAARDERRHEVARVRRAEEEIDLGQRLLELGSMPLDHATDGNHASAASALLEPTGVH